MKAAERQQISQMRRDAVLAQRQAIANLDVASAMSQRLLAKIDYRTFQAVISKAGGRLDPNIQALIQDELATRRHAERRVS